MSKTKPYKERKKNYKKQLYKKGPSRFQVLELETIGATTAVIGFTGITATGSFTGVAGDEITDDDDDGIAETRTRINNNKAEFNVIQVACVWARHNVLYAGHLRTKIYACTFD